MRKDFLLLLGIGLAASAQAQIASDTASNSPYVVGSEYIQVGTTPGDQTAATNGLNGGFGFNAWQRGGYGTSPNFGTTLITNLNASLNMGTQQFGMRSGAGGVGGADARRRLLNPLSQGQVLSASMMAGGGNAGTANTIGSFGVDFRSGLLSNPGRDMVSLDGAPGGFWKIVDRSGTITTTLSVTPGQRLDAALSMTGGDNYRLDLTPFGGSTTTTNGLFISTGQTLQTAQFFVFGTDGDFYVNNLKAVPEPASMLALGLGISALISRRRRK